MAFLVLLSACGPVEDKPEIPSDIKDTFQTWEPDGSNPKKVCFNLFYDNTQSMEGFAPENSMSEFVMAVESLKTISEGYENRSYYALGSNPLKWQKVSVFSYQKRSFYTYDGSFEERGLGPLQLLFDVTQREIREPALKVGDLNVIVTDLAEQNVNNKSFARALNQIFLEQNQSVALFCINSFFRGKAYVPLNGMISNSANKMFNGHYVGYRPFFVIVTGASVEVQNFCSEFAKELGKQINWWQDGTPVVEKDEGEFMYPAVEEGGFSYHIILAGRGLLSADLGKWTAQNFERPENTGVMGIGLNNSNANRNFLCVKYTDIFDEEAVRRLANELAIPSLPGLNYRYYPDEALNNASGRQGNINLIIPLNDLVNGTPVPESVTYSLGNYEVWAWQPADASEATTAEEDETQQVAYTWKKLTAYESNSIAVTGTRMRSGDEIEAVSGSTSDQASYLKKEEFKNEVLYTVEARSGAYFLKITFNDILALRKLGSHLSLRIPIYGSIARVEVPTPAWVKNYDLVRTREPDFQTPVNTPEYFSHVDGFTAFYEALNGKLISEEERQRYDNSLRKQVAMAIVNINMTAE